MSLDKITKLFFIIFIIHFFNGDHCFVKVLVKNVVHIKNISDTATHTCREVLSGFSENYHTATGHVLASMLTNTLNYCHCTGVTDCKTFTCNTVDKCSSACGTIECYVSDNDVLFCFVSGFFRNFDDQFTTGKAFSKVVIAVTGQFQCQSFRDKCTEALSACTCTVYSYGIFRKALFMVSRDLRSKDGTECTVCVGNIYINGNFLTFLDCRCTFLNQNFFIQSFLKVEIVYRFRIKRNFTFSCIWIVQDGA